MSELALSVRQATTAQWRAVLTSPREHLAFYFLFALGLLAAGLDAWTTLSMMNSGAFEEANGSAAYGMGIVGLEIYVALATLVSGLYGLLLLVRGPNFLWLAVPAAGLVFIAAKLYVGVSNLLLWQAWGV